MQELTNILAQASRTDIPTGEAFAAVDFTNAAVKWASACLRIHNGELLRKGLEIAACMVEFEDILRKP